ncbi:MAG: aminotransferase class IV [Candidatus Eisenbacteria bacterium]|nr:aminotransferase class IV [Candidatus Eisenbacteria bacterium]
MSEADRRGQAAGTRAGAHASPRPGPGAAAPVPDRVLWVNGRLCGGADAAISLFDRGARDGEGIFETLRVYGGQPFQWERHLERLVMSAAELGFPVPPSPAALLDALACVLEANRLEDAVARLTVTRGVPGGRPPRTGAWLEAEPLAARLWSGARRGSASAVISKTPFEPGALGRHKTTSRLAYHLAREEARAARADEALLVAADGELLEGAVSNLFVVLHGEALTPPLARGILPGIARASTLALCGALGIRAREARITTSDLDRAEEAFLTNSVQEVVPLAAVDGRALPGIETGSRLREAYHVAAARSA